MSQRDGKQPSRSISEFQPAADLSTDVLQSR